MTGIGGFVRLVSEFLRREGIGSDGKWRLMSDFRRSMFRFSESISGAANEDRDLRRSKPGTFKLVSWWPVSAGPDISLRLWLEGEETLSIDTDLG
jgi:hypothetical protein